MVGFPDDQIFRPTIADPKEAPLFVSLLRGTFRSLDDPSGEGTTIASVGLGDSFGLVRWGDPSRMKAFSWMSSEAYSRSSTSGRRRTT